MFHKRAKEKVTAPIKPSSVLLTSLESRSSKEMVISEHEKHFFIALEDNLRAKGLSVNYFHAERMGSGSIRLYCPAGIIGTVNLRKHFGGIQYFTSLYDVHDMNDAPVEAIIAVIPYWVEYAKYCIRIRNAAMSV